MDALAAGDDKKDAATDASATGGGAAASEAGLATPKPRENRQRESNVGQALRSVYQQTVNEDVPDEMLKLLGKLI